MLINGYKIEPGADLREVNFENVDLSESNLQETNFEGAELGNVGFENANLRGANLKCTSLIEAYLVGADLVNADLSRANIEDSYLSDADLRSAYLVGARLRNVCLQDANLESANLKDAKFWNFKSQNYETITKKFLTDNGAFFNEDTKFSQESNQESPEGQIDLATEVENLKAENLDLLRMIVKLLKEMEPNDQE